MYHGRSHTVICPYCELPATLRSGDVIWGVKWAHVKVYVCSQYPQCDAYGSVHRGTTKPLGTMANGELRTWRKRAHFFFDPIWREGFMKRTTAYRKLSIELGIDTKDCHIALFNVYQCQKTIEFSKKLQQERQGVQLG